MFPVSAATGTGTVRNSPVLPSKAKSVLAWNRAFYGPPVKIARAGNVKSMVELRAGHAAMRCAAGRAFAAAQACVLRGMEV
jgi:hypothetical protein